VFQKTTIQYQVDEIKYIKIQSLLQKEKPNPNDIKNLIDQLIVGNFRRVNNIKV